MTDRKHMFSAIDGLGADGMYYSGGMGGGDMYYDPYIGAYVLPVQAGSPLAPYTPFQANGGGGPGGGPAPYQANGGGGASPLAPYTPGALGGPGGGGGMLAGSPVGVPYSGPGGVPLSLQAPYGPGSPLVGSAGVVDPYMTYPGSLGPFAGTYDAMSSVYAPPSTVAGGPAVLSGSAAGAYTTPSKSTEFEEPETGGSNWNRPLTMMERHKQGLGMQQGQTMYERKGTTIQRAATTNFAGSKGNQANGGDGWWNAAGGIPAAKQGLSRYNSYGGPDSTDMSAFFDPKGPGKGNNAKGNAHKGNPQKGGSGTNTGAQKGAFAKGQHSKSTGNMDDMVFADITKRHLEAYKKAKGASTDEGVTCMLKNIPNKYTRQMLIQQLHTEYLGRINFLYMPIDFSTECNVGYAFINFRDQESADHFKEKYNQCHTKKCLPGYNSNKVAEVSYAAVQGLQANLDRLKRSPLLPMLKANEGWQPVMFDDGGEMISFPCESVGRPFGKKDSSSQKMTTPGVTPGSGGSLPRDDYGSLTTNASPPIQLTNDSNDSNPTTPNAGLQLGAAISGERISNVGMVPISGERLVPKSPPIHIMSPPTTAPGESAPKLGALSPTISHDSNSPNMQRRADFSQGSHSPNMESRESRVSQLERLSHLVQPACSSPKQKAISEQVRVSVTRKQIETFFDQKQKGDEKGDETRKELLEDGRILIKNMDAAGWISLNTLMALKRMVFPGHDLMVQCIDESEMLELDEAKTHFRCRDGEKATAMKAAFS